MKSPTLDKFLRGATSSSSSAAAVGPQDPDVDDDSIVTNHSRITYTRIHEDIQKLTHDTNQILDDMLHQVDMGDNGCTRAEDEDDASLQDELAHLEVSTSELHARLQQRHPTRTTSTTATTTLTTNTTNTIPTNTRKTKTTIILDRAATHTHPTPTNKGTDLWDESLESLLLDATLVWGAVVIVASLGQWMWQWNSGCSALEL